MMAVANRLGLCLLASLLVTPAMAQKSNFDASISAKGVLAEMGVDQKLGSQIPADARFKDAEGKDVAIGEYFGKRPIVIAPIFFQCISRYGVCGQEQKELVKMIIKLKKELPVGQSFDVIFLSIHPKETPELARVNKLDTVKIYDLPGSEGGFHFLTGSLDEIHKVTDALGFRYIYKPEADVINHPAGIMMLTPEGKVSKYLSGPTYPTVLFKSALADASRDKIGSVEVEFSAFGCIMTDPVTKRQTIVIERVLSLVGLVFLAGVIGMISFMGFGNKNKPKEEAEKL